MPHEMSRKKSKGLDFSNLFWFTGPSANRGDRSCAPNCIFSVWTLGILGQRQAPKRYPNNRVQATGPRQTVWQSLSKFNACSMIHGWDETWLDKIKSASWLNLTIQTRNKKNKVKSSNEQEEQYSEWMDFLHMYLWWTEATLGAPNAFVFRPIYEGDIKSFSYFSHGRKLLVAYESFNLPNSWRCLQVSRRERFSTP